MNELDLQDKVREMVRNEVVATVTSLVDELRELVLFEDFEERLENAYAQTCPECGDIVSAETISNGNDWGNDNDGEELADEDGDWLPGSGICPSCQAVIEEDDLLDEYQDVMEWYIVSGWLAGKLRDRGEVIFDDYIWGRCGSGQAVYMDSVMVDIARDAGRLG